MPHILCTLRAPLAAVQYQLKNDAEQHAKDGMYLEHVWLNAEDEGEVLFLFRVDDLDASQKRIKETHAKALAVNPRANLPAMTYLL